MQNNNILIGIFEYSSCNISSIKNAFSILKIKTLVSKDFKDLLNCKKIIIPGVGNMKSVSKDELKKTSNKIQIFLDNGGIVYGICLGLQMLFDYSEEGKLKTLGQLRGKSISLKDNFGINLNVQFQRLIFNEKINNPLIKKLFEGIKPDEKFYFLHKYYCEPNDPSITKIDSKVNHLLMPSMFVKNNIIGTQFHPELSKEVGLKFLENFSNLTF
tara:strand:+ start:403 stop:1044 length:642 start_codon:yes stop_codon:yes gene_type:complete